MTAAYRPMMTHLRTPEDSPLYEIARQKMGYVPNFVRPFALEPEIQKTWESLLAAVRSGLTPLRYELVTATGTEPDAVYDTRGPELTRALLG